MIFSSDANDNPPEFVDKVVHVSVLENTAIGTEVSRVMATSADIGVNSEISYSLHGSALHQSMDVHPKTGEHIHIPFWKKIIIEFQIVISLYYINYTR